jgi:hypothetical protein
MVIPPYVDLLIVTTSIIDDIHSKGELQWTDEFARFLEQVCMFWPTFFLAVTDGFYPAVCQCLEAHGGECASPGRGPDDRHDSDIVLPRYLHQ